MGHAARPPLNYLVEWYRSGLDDVQLDRIIFDLDRCARSMAVEGTLVRRVLMLAVPTDDVAFALFEAESPTAIEQICARAGITASRITVAVAERALRPQT